MRPRCDPEHRPSYDGGPDDLRDRLFSKTLTVRSELRSPTRRGYSKACLQWRPGATCSRPTSRGSDAEPRRPGLTRALVKRSRRAVDRESRHSLEDVYLELIDEDVEAGAR